MQLDIQSVVDKDVMLRVAKTRVSRASVTNENAPLADSDTRKEGVLFNTFNAPKREKENQKIRLIMGEMEALPSQLEIPM